MERQMDANRLAREIGAKLAELPSPTTPAVRAVRRGYSRLLASATPQLITEAAFVLSRQGHRFFAYELVAQHRAAFASLTLAQVLKFGEGMNSWSDVDCFACILSGPVWRHGRLSPDVIRGWAASTDPWWRRAALVSTVALSRRGNAEDVRQTIEICALLTADREDLVVKALSWALRELAKKHGGEVRKFLSSHGETLAARVTREVRNKLTTGLKNPIRG
jgi:3-methyladenine DNA glycosylase AlkD